MQMLSKFYICGAVLVFDSLTVLFIVKMQLLLVMGITQVTCMTLS